MDWSSTILHALLGGAIGFLSVYLFRWLRSPKPVDRHEMKRLRAEALRLIEESDRSEFNVKWDKAIVAKRGKLEQLRLFVRLKGQYHLTVLDSIVTGLRASREKMKTSEITVDHVEMYREIIGLWQVSVDNVKEQEKNSLKLNRIAFYAMSHFDQSQRILHLVRDRKMMDLSEIKQTLREMETVSNDSLAEGML